MSMEWGMLQSAISASAGLLGVWLGGRLTWQRESKRESERNLKEANYLAILVVAHLERLATSCLYVANDNGLDEEGAPAGSHGCNETTTDYPIFDPLEINVNWKALPLPLMYDILGLTYRIEQLNREIASEWVDDPPEYTEFFWARQYGYAVLGLAVSEMAQRLREHASLPALYQQRDGVSRDSQLRKQRDAVHALRRPA